MPRRWCVGATVTALIATDGMPRPPGIDSSATHEAKVATGSSGSGPAGSMTPTVRRRSDRSNDASSWIAVGSPSRKPRATARFHCVKPSKSEFGEQAKLEALLCESSRRDLIEWSLELRGRDVVGHEGSFLWVRGVQSARAPGTGP